MRNLNSTVPELMKETDEAEKIKNMERKLFSVPLSNQIKVQEI
jgi:hypothetical protein